MEVEVKLPKPGDQLPFVVAEWDGQFPGWRYRLVYVFDQRCRKAFPFTEHQIKGGKWLHAKDGKALASFLGLPEAMLADSSVVATTIEGGGE